jgi:hypothetical protein
MFCGKFLFAIFSSGITFQTHAQQSLIDCGGYVPENTLVVAMCRHHWKLGIRELQLLLAFISPSWQMPG